MPMTSRQLSELVQRAAAASAERAEAAAGAEAPPPAPVARHRALPSGGRSAPVFGPEGVGKKAPIAGTLRLPAGSRGVLETEAGQRARPAPAPSAEPMSTSATSNAAAKSYMPTLQPAPSEAAALTADERRERRDRRLARHQVTVADITAVTWRLMERWPAVFGEHRRALAIGIHRVILAELPDCNRQALSIALRQWCSHPAYLRALSTGRHRHSLAGEDVAELTEAENAVAWRELQELRQKRTDASSSGERADPQRG